MKWERKGTEREVVKRKKQRNEKEKERGAKIGTNGKESEGAIGSGTDGRSCKLSCTLRLQRTFY